MIGTDLLTWQVPPTLEGVGELRRQVALGLGGTGLSPSRQGQILLALSELAANLVQHSQPRPDRIGVRVYREREGWHLEIEDNGGPLLDWRARLNTRAIECDDLRVAEHGRGLALVAAMFPDALYVPRTDAGERNRWRLDLGEHGAAALASVEESAHPGAEARGPAGSGRALVAGSATTGPVDA